MKKGYLNEFLKIMEEGEIEIEKTNWNVIAIGNLQDYTRYNFMKK